jgi:hypothetical protein
LGKGRNTSINIETEHVFLLRKRRELAMAWCVECAQRTRMVNADEAAILSRFSTRAICRLAEAGRIHFTETAEGVLMVCFRSLSDLEAAGDS